MTMNEVTETKVNKNFQWKLVEERHFQVKKKFNKDPYLKLKSLCLDRVFSE